jgi:hypothetical protein
MIIRLTFRMLNSFHPNKKIKKHSKYLTFLLLSMAAKTFRFDNGKFNFSYKWNEEKFYLEKSIWISF